MNAQGIVTRMGEDPQGLRGEAIEPGPAKPDAPMALRRLLACFPFVLSTDDQTNGAQAPRQVKRSAGAARERAGACPPLVTRGEQS